MRLDINFTIQLIWFIIFFFFSISFNLYFFRFLCNYMLYVHRCRHVLLLFLFWTFFSLEISSLSFSVSLSVYYMLVFCLVESDAIHRQYYRGLLMGGLGGLGGWVGWGGWVNTVNWERWKLVRRGVVYWRSVSRGPRLSNASFQRRRPYLLPILNSPSLFFSFFLLVINKVYIYIYIYLSYFITHSWCKVPYHIYIHTHLFSAISGPLALLCSCSAFALLLLCLQGYSVLAECCTIIATTTKDQWSSF